jgi:hypothetical protein
LIDLRCPHCGGALIVNLETKGSAYMHYEVPESIECNDYCEAVWEPDGTARDEPKWIRYPGLYKPPGTAR